MKRILILAAFLTLSTLAMSQYRNRGGGGFNPDNLYFGGGFGLSIGTDVTNVSVAPLVGYRITDEFSSGVSFSYQYVKWREANESLSNVGGSLFARYLFSQEVFGHAEYEILGYDQVTGITTQGEIISTRETNKSMFVGIGYRQDAGRNASFFILGLYDLLWKNENGLYPIPYTVRAGFAVGF